MKTRPGLKVLPILFESIRFASVRYPASIPKRLAVELPDGEPYFAEVKLVVFVVPGGNVRRM